MPSLPSPKSPRIVAWLLAAVALSACATVSSPLIAFKNRLFGAPDPEVVNAPVNGVVMLLPGRPERLIIDAVSPTRQFPKGESAYRIIELPDTVAHASLQVRVLARARSDAAGHSVFRPIVYLLDDADKVQKAVEVKPLHLDIRPFRRTRLLGCVKLEDVHRFALATMPASIGKSYESEVRDSLKAPTRGGFYYRTDAVKVKLPYVAFGELVLEITGHASADEGC